VALCGFNVPVVGVSLVDKGYASLIFGSCVGAEYVESLVVPGVDALFSVGALVNFHFGGYANVNVLGV
jgi:Ca2+/Na+ antiporter